MKIVKADNADKLYKLQYLNSKWKIYDISYRIQKIKIRKKKNFTFVFSTSIFDMYQIWKAVVFLIIL